MSFLILTETSAGYALFKARDKKLLKRDDLAKEISTSDGICGQLKLKQFSKFDSAATALEEVTSLIEGKVSPMLAGMLDSLKDEKKASLAVADVKLGNAINKIPGLSLNIVSDSTTQDLYRSIREHLTSLIPGLLPSDLNTMSLGLSHSLSRHKLKFSPDKVDTMIVQAIALLDDLDKQLNTYAMRLKEWYGWHFPEMAKIINDNMAYARVIKIMGVRSNASTSDLSTVLPEEIENALKAAAEISMGTEITKEDLDNINSLAEEVIGFSEYRTELATYLSNRMQAIAPNLTALVGELVGARLIAHAGSLMNLAKSPASTIQILGAEKALFRALKTKHDTPKYGLIYQASLIGQSTGKNKGKIARMLATKTSLGIRYDALAEDKEESSALGIYMRQKVENRVRYLEGKPTLPKLPSNGVQPGKWSIQEAKKYNPDADEVMEDAPAAADLAKAAVADLESGEAMEDVAFGDEDSDKKEKKKKSKEDRKKEKKEKKRKLETADGEPVDQEGAEEEATAAREKKEKKEKKKDKKDKHERKKRKPSEEA
ncbi:Nucleolar protein 58 [Orbilia oligospora]|uniref:Nucleolar protein 58 n=1 Tax=Orbilia oligospora TaxID=2813651 RepID=A0A6G1LWD7_ORBOL|nr:Nucleolar protein 58 [Orbilia oligospora]KAF3199520.1 Nucleolar protein 58 [Orbilia oligospora]KAF3200088.1 Nucleolar protein 58 [Orbilia oligospora]KAF3201422.1 Nucleolar protein 58 [Orbilia oligospora]KAF3235219.1 Nucleolar protein 58 [Orbilia oligospora]